MEGFVAGRGACVTEPVKLRTTACGVLNPAAMRVQRWLLPTVLCAVAVIAAGDAVMVLRHPKEVATGALASKPAVPDHIGLAAARDGDGLRVEWNRNASMVRRATHGLLYIEDGRYQSQFSLTDQQLTDSAIQYWPETENVRFRLELYRGSESVADEVRIAAERSGPVVHTASRTVVERARPSPFERTRPEVVRRQLTPTAVSAALVRRPADLPPDTPVAEPKRKGFLSRIPLLRRLKRHPQTTDPLEFDDNPEHR